MGACLGRPTSGNDGGRGAGGAPSPRAPGRPQAASPSPNAPPAFQDGEASDADPIFFDAREDFTPTASPNLSPRASLDRHTARLLLAPQNGSQGEPLGGAGVSEPMLPAGRGASSPAEEQEQYDAAMLAFLNKLHGCSARTMREIPEFPIIPQMMVDKDGFRGRLTPSQEAALSAFKERYPRSEAWHTESDLLKFLRARDFDLPATYKMYDDYLRDYRGHHFVSPFPVVRPVYGPSWPMDQLAAEIGAVAPRGEVITLRMTRLFDFFMSGMVFRHDVMGHPVVYLRVADGIKRSYGKHVPVEDRLAMQAASMEMVRLLCYVASARSKVHIESVVQVMDLGDAPITGLLESARSPDSKKEANLNADFFPEILHKVHVVNAPYGMSTLFSIVKTFLPPKTAFKVHVYGWKDYQKVLREEIGAANLPKIYGGDVDFMWPAKKDMQSLPARM